MPTRSGRQVLWATTRFVLVAYLLLSLIADWNRYLDHESPLRGTGAEWPLLGFFGDRSFSFKDVPVVVAKIFSLALLARSFEWAQPRVKPIAKWQMWAAVLAAALSVLCLTFCARILESQTAEFLLLPGRYVGVLVSGHVLAPDPTVMYLSEFFLLTALLLYVRGMYEGLHMKRSDSRSDSSAPSMPVGRSQRK